MLCNYWDHYSQWIVTSVIWVSNLSVVLSLDLYLNQIESQSFLLVVISKVSFVDQMEANHYKNDK